MGENADGHFTLNTADGGLIMTIVPPEGEGKLVEFEEIRDAITKLGISEVVWDNVQSEAENPTGFARCLIEPTHTEGDAQIFVEISDDELSASVTVAPPEPRGKPATLDRIRAVLASSGVVYGIDDAALQGMEGPISAMTNPDEIYEPVEAKIASGREVVHGQDAVLEKFYEKKAEKVELKEGEVENKNESVDYREMNTIDNVKEGTVLAKKIDAIQGEAGITVTGNNIEPQIGEDLVITPGEGVKTEEADPNSFVSTAEGQVVLKDNVLSVLAIFEVDGDLDLKVGNIDFIGTVTIKGNVSGEYKIKCGEDLIVEGVLEGAEVDAGGNVEIKGGIIGQKTRVVAEGNVFAKFVRNAGRRDSQHLRDFFLAQFLINEHG